MNSGLRPSHATRQRPVRAPSLVDAFSHDTEVGVTARATPGSRVSASTDGDEFLAKTPQSASVLAASNASHARVAELADAQVLGTCGRKPFRVQVPALAPWTRSRQRPAQAAPVACLARGLVWLVAWEP